MANFGLMKKEIEKLFAVSNKEVVSEINNHVSEFKNYQMVTQKTNLIIQ